MTDVFSAETPAEPLELDLGLNDLVGEGKKYSDPDQLAKAYANVERHARTLEAERAADRAKIDVLEAKNSSNTPPDGEQEQPPAVNQPPVAPNAPNPGSNDGEFKAKIRQEVEALDAQRLSVRNVEEAAQRMVEHFGDVSKANEAVRRRALELGVNVDWLQEAASKSPSAFFATMGITEGNHSTNTPAPNSEVNFNRAGEVRRDFEFYDKIRKDNPKLYYLAATQSEMYAQAKKMGDEFYKR